VNETLPYVSVVVPAYNASYIIGKCLAALRRQTYPHDLFEIIVVDDGSSDDTAKIASSMGIKVLVQPNQGPAVARNLGAEEARGELVLFTDSDCEPQGDWIACMVEPFTDPEIVGTKGFYKTRQKEIIARFAQIEYDVKCDMLKKNRYIDFVDTYSAAYRRDVFLEVGGFDAIYTTASGEDSELSYKLSLIGYKMVPVPNAFVFHQHPNTLFKYLKKKYRNAYWRIVTWSKYPQKIAKDSHTPNSYKFQVLISPLILLALIGSIILGKVLLVIAIFLTVIFMGISLPFAYKAIRRDVTVGILSFGLLYLRGIASAFGALTKIISMIRGRIIFAKKYEDFRKPNRDGSKSVRKIR